MSRKISNAIRSSDQPVLNVYFTAGHPSIADIPDIIHALYESGVDLIELGMPYSDPLADGLTIQQSSAHALKNGMNLEKLFESVKKVKAQGTTIPIIVMGYYNQMLKYGADKYLQNCRDCGVDGLIIPDLPMEIFEAEYQQIFNEYGIGISFLITPHTSEGRIRYADKLSTDFIYAVSQATITGKTGSFSDEQIKYFSRLKAMNLNNPFLIGFGIHNSETFCTATEYANGAIVGSAFIRHLDQHGPDHDKIASFIQQFKKLNHK